jgi:hypothetical protein
MVRLSNLMYGAGPQQFLVFIISIFYMATSSIGLEQQRKFGGPKSQQDFLSVNLAMSLGLGVLALYYMGQTVALY